MLGHFLPLIEEALARESKVILSTYGTAGLQAGYFPCQAAGNLLYILVPETLDLLANLEQWTRVIVTTAAWQVSGQGCLLEAGEISPELALIQSPENRWCRVVKVRISRFEKAHLLGWGFSECIDLEGA